MILEVKIALTFGDKEVLVADWGSWGVLVMFYFFEIWVLVTWVWSLWRSIDLYTFLNVIFK